MTSEYANNKSEDGNVTFRKALGKVAKLGVSIASKICDRCSSDPGLPHLAYTCKAACEYYLYRLALCAKHGERDWFMVNAANYDRLVDLEYDVDGVSSSYEKRIDAHL